MFGRTVFVFGNLDLEFDSLPLRIIEDLKKHFPNIQFEVKDPNEEWDVPKDLIVIDTVWGIERITIFDSLDKFENSPRTSLHDFDALFYLQHLKKLGKLDKIKIIGLPMMMDKEEAVAGVGEILSNTK